MPDIIPIARGEVCVYRHPHYERARVMYVDPELQARANATERAKPVRYTIAVCAGTTRDEGRATYLWLSAKHIGDRTRKFAVEAHGEVYSADPAKQEALRPWVGWSGTILDLRGLISALDTLGPALTPGPGPLSDPDAF